MEKVTSSAISDDESGGAVSWPAHIAPSLAESLPSADEDQFIKAEDYVTDDAHLDSNDAPTFIPVHKRRRVTRACDECRRKKIKCDGRQPCTHCSVYTYGE